MRLHTALPSLLLHLIERRLETGRKCVDICFLSEGQVRRSQEFRCPVSNKWLRPCHNKQQQQQQLRDLPHPRTAAG